MDEVYFVLGHRHGYTKILFGIYDIRSLAEARIKELKNEEYSSIDEYEIEYFAINSDIEYQF